MQALESLNDSQVNEFLCGKAPLNLSMRLGDHVMLIQLQLSTVSGIKASSTSSSTSSATTSSPASSSTSSSSGTSSPTLTSGPPSLLQASRNLQHTLRRLSADVFSGRDRGRFWAFLNHIWFARQRNDCDWFLTLKTFQHWNLEDPNNIFVRSANWRKALSLLFLTHQPKDPMQPR